MTARKSLHIPRFLLYFFQHLQAIKLSIRQLSVEPLSSIMTFAVIGIALALPMGLFVLLQNVQTITHGLHDTAQISLYLNMNVKQKQIDNLLRVLQKDEGVAQVKYISPQEALKDFQKQSEFSDVLTELKNNPLPGVIIIKPIKNINTRAQINYLFSRLKKLPLINKAQLDMAWLKRLSAIIKLGNRIIYAVMALFAFGVLLIIGNTIRLTTQRYQDEISVLKFLGATKSFIRRPFLYSGIIYGLVGGIIAWLLVDTTMWWLRNPAEQLSNLYGMHFQLQGLNLSSTLVLLISGSLLGYLGSWIAVGKHHHRHS